MDMDRLLKFFYFSGPQDFNAIELAFSENRKHDRRQWIMAFEVNLCSLMLYSPMARLMSLYH